MHVDGGATQSFFFVPQVNNYLPGGIEGLAGASVYVVVNGQMSVAEHTTAVQALPILSRSFSATMKHMARTEIGAAYDFARRNRMNFRFTMIPPDYPYLGPSSSIQELFGYARRCAAEGRIWAGLEKAFPRIEPQKAGSAGTAPAACPGALALRVPALVSFAHVA